MKAEIPSLSQPSVYLGVEKSQKAGLQELKWNDKLNSLDLFHLLGSRA